jgi:modulator of FtsH protease
MVNSGVAYDPAQWAVFFSAEASASAALIGLLFVAVSINLPSIVSNPLLTARAAKALSTLAGVLFAATLCLVPGQSKTFLGLELLLVEAVIWIMITICQRASARGNRYMSRQQKIWHAILAQCSCIPLMIGGVSLVIGHDGGLYWLVAGVIISFIAALLDAWVLLIEIQR